MEGLKEKIESFLTNGNGYGDGYGDGNGNGYGDGYGYGDGNGYGYGYGYGNGYGDGNGNGYGYGYGYGDGNGNGNGYGDGNGSFKKFNGRDVYYIDGLPTIILSVHGTFAKGLLLEQDFILKHCFVARVGDCFAHGDTLAEAVSDALAKHTRNMPIEERVAQFNATYPDRTAKIPAKELFNWHNVLTDSCLFGRQSWCRERGINIETDSFTVDEFIELTKDSYGGNIIRKLITINNQPL